jgi:hypothetical protein
VADAGQSEGYYNQNATLNNSALSSPTSPGRKKERKKERHLKFGSETNQIMGSALILFIGSWQAGRSNAGKKNGREFRKECESMLSIIRYPVVGTHSSATLSAIQAIPCALSLQM